MAVSYFLVIYIVHLYKEDCTFFEYVELLEHSSPPTKKQYTYIWKGSYMYAYIHMYQNTNIPVYVYIINHSGLLRQHSNATVNKLTDQC